MFQQNYIFIDKNNYFSQMNLSFNYGLTTDDYIEVVVDDSCEYRLDLIAKKYLGSSDYYMYIMFINDLNDENNTEFSNMEKLKSGNVIKIPKTSYINNFLNTIKIERAR